MGNTYLCNSSAYCGNRCDGKNKLENESSQKELIISSPLINNIRKSKDNVSSVNGG